MGICISTTSIEDIIDLPPVEGIVSELQLLTNSGWRHAVHSNFDCVFPKAEIKMTSSLYHV